MTQPALTHNREAEEAAETIDTVAGEAPWHLTWTTAPRGAGTRSHELPDEARGAAYRLAWEVELARQWDVAQCSSRVAWRENQQRTKAEAEADEQESNEVRPADPPRDR